MGYDLHITRAEDWVESANQPIFPSEWLKCINDDPELCIDANSPNDSEPWAVWRGSGQTVLNEDEQSLFLWNDGQIGVKNPDSATIRKMVQIAAIFGARVVGDDGEEHFQNGELVVERHVETGLLARLWAKCRNRSIPERKFTRDVLRWDE